MRVTHTIILLVCLLCLSSFVSGFSWESTADLQVFSVSDFGAVGDNKTDCTLAVVKATSEMVQAGSKPGSGGAVLFFPAGEYLFTTAPSSLAYVEIWTEAPNARFIIAGAGEGNTTLSFYPSLSKLFYLSGAVLTQPIEFTLEELTIALLDDPAPPPNQPFVPIDIEGTQNSIVQKITIQGTNTDDLPAVIAAYTSSNLTLSSLTFSVEAESASAIQSTNVTQLQVSDVNIQTPADYNHGIGYGIQIIQSQQVTIENVNINATIKGGDVQTGELNSGIYLGNVTDASILHVTLADPFGVYEALPYFILGLVIDGSTSASVYDFTALNIGTGIWLRTAVNLPWSTEKEVSISGSNLQDCPQAGILVTDNSTLIINGTTFGGSAYGSAYTGGAGILSTLDTMVLSANNTNSAGMSISVFDSTFTNLGANGISIRTGTLRLEQCNFHDLNVALSFQYWTLPKNTTSAPGLVVHNNTFHNVEQYVMFINLLDEWSIVDNTCTISGPRAGVLDSNTQCYGQCQTENNVGCTFNQEP